MPPYLISFGSDAGVGIQKSLTPTVVKTSWSLLTSVISPGSLTFILTTIVSQNDAGGCVLKMS